MIYLGPAGLPEKKENIYLKHWDKHFLPGIQILSMHIDCEPTMHWHEHFHISYLIGSSK